MRTSEPGASADGVHLQCQRFAREPLSSPVVPRTNECVIEAQCAKLVKGGLIRIVQHIGASKVLPQGRSTAVDYRSTA